jgi:hypothetical protein
VDPAVQVSGHAGRSNLVVVQAKPAGTHAQVLRPADSGGDGGARGRLVRGPTGPGAHRGGSGDVGVAGDGLVAV